ncbi:hypothetical protein TFLX_03541 [Thermoflexales bacterium]|nr:hypothetical protein TFLX_03541 [Thermoflexales bacterium]
MFQRLENSWRLVKASWSVLRADKELLIFPIVSAVATLIVTLTFFIPAILTFASASIVGRQRAVEPLWVLLMVAFYVIQYTIIFFCNTALVGAAMIRLKGGDPTVSDGFRIAFEHFRQIVAYAVIAATVGMILRWLSERGILGRLVSSLFGLAWNVATYLVVPVLVIENLGPIEAIKRSTGLLRKTWGEQIVGNLGIGFVFGLIFFGVILLFVPVITAVVATKSIALIVAAIGGLVLLLIGLGLFSSALNGIYTAAVYRYATEGQVGEYFEADLVQNAFRQK